MEIATTFIVALYISKRQVYNQSSVPNLYESCLGFLKLLILMAIIGAIIDPSSALRPPTGAATIRAFGDALLPYQLFGTIFIVNANSLGGMAAVLLLISIIRLLYAFNNLTNGIWIFISFVVLVLAQSRTAWLGLFVAISFLLLTQNLISKRIKILSLGLLILSFYYSQRYLILYLTRGVSFEVIQNMSGRAIWWKIAFNQYLNLDLIEKIIGLGYMIASRTILESKLDKTITTLHSDYMDALISTGFIGALVLILIVLAMFIKT